MAHTTPVGQKRLLCLGYGYVAAALARSLAAAGWRVGGTRRGAGGAAGPETIAFDGSAPSPTLAAALGDATHLLISVPPDEAGDPILRHHAPDIARRRELAWIGYLSSTGVYGDRGGAWVDEASAPSPTSATGRRRLAAEVAWQALARAHGLPLHVFRLAGIYGPGRSALEQVLSGAARRIVKPGHAVSRIHVDDVVAVLAASIARPEPGAIYNVCDDEPAPTADVVAYAAALLGLAPPAAEPFESAVLAPAQRRFYDENRRVANRRIKETLGVALAYPDYRAGLTALRDARA